MGATYEFRISAKNAVDFGEQAVETIRTPDGSEFGRDAGGDISCLVRPVPRGACVSA